MEKVIFRYRFVVLLFAVVILLGTFTACRGGYYFSHDGIYYSEMPFIELNCPRMCGTMIIDGTTYQLHLSYSNNGTKIWLRDADILSQSETDEYGYLLDYDKALIWEADTKEENGKLYLTVTEDNISDYVGKTIVLEFQPYE